MVVVAARGLPSEAAFMSRWRTSTAALRVNVKQSTWAGSSPALRVKWIIRCTSVSVLPAPAGAKMMSAAWISWTAASY